MGGRVCVGAAGGRLGVFIAAVSGGSRMGERETRGRNARETRHRLETDDRLSREDVVERAVARARRRCLAPLAGSVGGETLVRRGRAPISKSDGPELALLHTYGACPAHCLWVPNGKCAAASQCAGRGRRRAAASRSRTVVKLDGRLHGCRRRREKGRRKKGRLRIHGIRAGRTRAICHGQRWTV